MWGQGCVVGVFTSAWEFPGQQLMEHSGVIGGTEGGHQGPDSVPHPRLISSPLGWSVA